MSELEELETKANSGDADAMFQLGVAYAFGRGVVINLDEALHWLKKAAWLGHKDAMCVLNEVGIKLKWKRRLINGLKCFVRLILVIPVLLAAWNKIKRLVKDHPFKSGAVGVGLLALIFLSFCIYDITNRGIVTSVDQKSGDVKIITLPGGALMEMVYCEPGTFETVVPTYSENRFYFFNKTRRNVTLTKGFWLGKYPVSQEQWKSVMGGSASIKGGVWGYECQEFIDKLNSHSGYGARFPTEAEWEYACLAGLRWWNILKDDKPYLVDYRNAWGFVDMLNGDKELCEDLAVARDDDPDLSRVNPLGAKFKRYLSGEFKCHYRVWRGKLRGILGTELRGAMWEYENQGSFRLCCSAKIQKKD